MHNSEFKGRPRFRCLSRRIKGIFSSNVALNLSLLLLAPTLSACGTMGFPHVGTVDTRHNAPGTIKAQLSAGAGSVGVIYPVGLAVAAAVNTDNYVKPNLSIAASGQFLAGVLYVDQVLASARVGLRYRPTQRLSLGMGAFGGGSGTWASKGRSLNLGGDLEIATSRVRPNDHFASHAWRLSVGHSPTDRELTGTLLGDWSRSRPTRNKNIRFSYGLNYGINLSTELQAPRKAGAEPNDVDRGLDFTYFFGVHVGMQWGGKWGQR